MRRPTSQVKAICIFKGTTTNIQGKECITLATFSQDLKNLKVEIGRNVRVTNDEDDIMERGTLITIE